MAADKKPAAKPPAPVGDVTPVVLGDGPPADPPADPRDAELAALRAELIRAGADRDAARREAAHALDAAAALQLEVEAIKAGPAYEPGRRYLVRLPDVPAYVVEPGPGEHPFEAFKRAAGVLSSVHAPEIAPTDLPAGRVA